MSMRVGIVTVYDSANIGSFMQALAMQEVVKMHGGEPYMIKIRSRFKSWIIFQKYVFQPDEKMLKKTCKYLIGSIKHPKQVLARHNRFLEYSNDWSVFDRIVTAEEANKIGMDAVLLGSDEIWNSNFKAFLNPLLYGIGLSSNKKFAYAVSVGGMDRNNWKRYTDYFDAIKKLNGIYARDKKTVQYLHDYGVEASGMICDPTLQCDIRSYMKSNKRNAVSGKYIVVYSYSVSKTMQEHIKLFAKKNGLKTVALSLEQPWCDEYINCSPLEFGDVLKNAEYVYTSTFHGTIFSVLYHKRFITVSVLDKVHDVAKLMGVSSQYIQKECNYDEFETVITNTINYTEVDREIEKLKDHAYSIYESALGEVI